MATGTIELTSYWLGSISRPCFLETYARCLLRPFILVARQPLAFGCLAFCDSLLFGTTAGYYTFGVALREDSTAYSSVGH